ncbi:MAG TPA: response regulator [Pirellulales bacterium]|jgi:two-component system KDP operon response regulator KdpE|nr:response regulator [Pirellulales bacterium]
MSTKICETQTARPALGSSTSPPGREASGEEISAAFLCRPARPKVMLVDDDKLNSFVIAEYLKSDGYRDLVYTTNPCDAVALGHHMLPGLILLDLNMPELGGLDVLRRLRADEAFARSVIVVLTASHDEQLKSRAIDLGAADFIYKGTDRESLLARLRSAVLAAEQDQAG